MSDGEDVTVERHKAAAAPHGVYHPDTSTTPFAEPAAL